jgi:drug/metabolite transporter (DMT)-like permease
MDGPQLNIVIWAALALFVLIAAIAIIIKKKSGRARLPEDYYTLFIIGVAWLPIGILMWVIGDASIVNVFTLIGFIFLVIGLSHKSEWKKRKRLSERERKFKIWAVVGIVVLFLIGLVFYLTG